jgi:FkbM family methyltransferase
MLILKLFRNYLKSKKLLEFYSQFIQKGDLCFDIGANVGKRTEAFLKLGASVLAVEPQQSCYHLLNSKFYTNNNVKLLKAAVGNTNRMDELMICDEESACSTLSNKFINTYSNISNLHWSKKEKIEVRTLQNICNEFGKPKFCKIDVEGYESEVLNGLNEPIKFICLEFNRPLLHDTLKSLEILNSLGNYQCNFIKFEHMHVVLKQWLPIETFRNHLYELITEDTLTGEIIAECLDN